MTFIFSQHFSPHLFRTQVGQVGNRWRKKRVRFGDICFVKHFLSPSFSFGRISKFPRINFEQIKITRNLKESNFDFYPDTLSIKFLKKFVFPSKKRILFRL